MLGGSWNLTYTCRYQAASEAFMGFNLKLFELKPALSSISSSFSFVYTFRL